MDERERSKEMNKINNTLPPRDKITPKMIEVARLVDPKFAEQLEEVVINSPTEVWLKKFKSQHPTIEKIKNQVRIIAPLNDPVMILGESGTGKELIAHSMHGDREGKFVAINCAGLPENLLESEFFGHEKGAFSYAHTKKIGLLEEAKDGTIFLDEIGELKLDLQSKLLRAIEDMSIRRVGGNEEIAINCRIICATHENLEELIEKRLFREDLYWRINIFDIKVPPLIARTGDIPVIVDALDIEDQIEDIKEFCKHIDPSKLTGNVRSLQKIVRRYVVLGLMPHQ